MLLFLCAREGVLGTLKVCVVGAQNRFRIELTLALGGGQMPNWVQLVCVCVGSTASCRTWWCSWYQNVMFPSFPLWMEVAGVWQW
jgi:hypothetical protein